MTSFHVTSFPEMERSKPNAYFFNYVVCCCLWKCILVSTRKLKGGIVSWKWEEKEEGTIFSYKWEEKEEGTKCSYKWEEDGFW